MVLYMSVAEVEAVLRDMRFSLLNALNDDLLEEVCAHLDRRARTAFFHACARVRAVYRSSGLQRTRRIDASIERAELAFNGLADQFFYSYPSMVEPGAYVFVDWTPFNRKPVRPACVIKWSPCAPHMRVDAREATLRAAIARAIDWDIGSVRLTMHVALDVEDDHNFFSARVRDSQRVLRSRLSIHPMRALTLELMRKRSWEPSPYHATLARAQARTASAHGRR